MNTALPCCALSLWLSSAPVAFAQAEPPHEETSAKEEIPPHERPPVGVWLARAAPYAGKPVRPTVLFSRDDFTHIQANLDASGNNILGDAANEPSIAIDPTAPNRMVIGWRQFDTIASNFRQAGWAYSHDGGRSWAFPGVIERGIFRSDPVLEVDTDGTFYYNSLAIDPNYHCHIFRSFDGGVSWDEGTYAFGADKQWFVIDRTDSEGRNHIYHDWSSGGSTGNRKFNRSTDRGDSYEEPLELPRRAYWGQLDVASDGTLYLCGRGNDYSTFNLNRSSNAKFADQTPVFEWSTPIDLGGSLGGWVGGSPNPGGLLGQVNIAVDRSEGPTAGNVYVLASVIPDGDDPLEVHFVRSEDGGVTWTAPIRVNDDPLDANNWQWFGTLSVAPNGRIDVVWNDTRNTGDSELSQLFYAYSTDGGDTWSSNEAISDVYNSVIGWPDQNKIGDYYDMTSDLLGAHLAWSNTFNGEQDVYYTRIGDYDCNGNGVADAEDIASLASEDCNFNGIPDECELAAGTAVDLNDDGILDQCQRCVGDVDGDGATGQSDLGLLLVTYEIDPGNPLYNGDADLDADGDVDQADLAILLADYECQP
ncbi:MAG: sialidase family protein [Phycisphaerales bacterium JB038]